MSIRIVRAPDAAAALGRLPGRLLGCFLVGCLSWQAALAVEQGFYVGANYAQVKSEADKAGYDAVAVAIYASQLFVPVQSSSTFDAKDSGYGFYGGYRMFANLAFEGGYMELGEVAYRDQSVGTYAGSGTETWGQNLTTSTSGLALSALGILPLSYRAELYARGGVIFVTNELDIYITDGVLEGRGSTSKSSTNFLAGVGGGFTFAEIYTARLEYQRVFDVGLDEFGKADIDVISVGVTVSF